MDIFGTPTEIKISVMKAIAELQNPASDIFVYDKKICDHVEYDETDKKLLVKQTLFDLTFLGVLARTGSSFALRQNLIVQVPSENLKRAFELKQKKKVLGNVNSKVKYTNHKKKQNFEDKEKIETEIDSLFAFYFEEFKNIKTINNPESSKARTPSRLGSTGLDDDNIILHVSAPINDQTSKPMENVVENVQSKRKITMAKEIGNFKAMKKSYSCPELNFLFALKNIGDNPNVYVSKRGSILGSLGLKKANNIMSINALKDQEYSSRWKFTDPLVI
ncbi:uncharacterized protein LOC133848915 isoform X2 [Drosophila sulfurigaster albostrigata]|uniref:uncharacterized protein LOC133848915 isoform X2 n=1 Tax=Drosophila sulfurigaster albostrigata TaxID=89887 RepID=UPI002D21EA0F|nr:uncharacterized protein LOC133848915 isoform X2 [Drosophila sulfurigaster albostrigata]